MRFSSCSEHPILPRVNQIETKALSNSSERAFFFYIHCDMPSDTTQRLWFQCVSTQLVLFWFEFFPPPPPSRSLHRLLPFPLSPSLNPVNWFRNCQLSSPLVVCQHSRHHVCNILQTKEDFARRFHRTSQNSSDLWRHAAIAASAAADATSVVFVWFRTSRGKGQSNIHVADSSLLRRAYRRI